MEHGTGPSADLRGTPLVFEQFPMLPAGSLYGNPYWAVQDFYWTLGCLRGLVWEILFCVDSLTSVFDSPFRGLLSSRAAS